MAQSQPSTAEQSAPKKSKTNIPKLLGASLVGLVIFALGLGIGNGTIALDPASRLLSTQNESLPEDLDYESVEQVYDSLKANYDGELNAQEILDGLKEGLAQASGDPYTEYFNPEEAEDFNAELNGTFSGIGAELGKEDELIVIVSPIDGFPAEEAGLRPKDAIIEIDGESAYDLSISEAVEKIRGPVGTAVKLKIVRNQSKTIEFEITRQTITIPSVEYEITDENIGYLKVSRFADDTVSLSEEAARSFKQAGVKGVILDVRGDPGGLLDAAVQLSSLWLDKGEVVLQEKRGGVVIKTFKANGNNILGGVPTVVLINQGSASASEIVAGALKDNNAATIIGEQSFGKGSVQSLINLGDGAVLKVTIARWFTPNGNNIDKEGITPDQMIERTEKDFEQERDPQLDAAKQQLLQ